MNSRVRVIFCGTMIVLLALISAFSVIPARADDGAPPPPAGGASPKTSTPTVLSQASSAGTDVVVVNDSGHKVPLASQEAAKIVAAGDPVWCPTGVVPGSAKCSPAASNTRLQDVITWLGTQTKGKAGVIWIEGYDPNTGIGYISSSIDSGITAFTLDGSTTGSTPALAYMAPYSLTINGGWTGTRTILNPNSPSVFDGASLSIYHWKNTVTLNNLIIEYATGNGLAVTTTANIVLNNINSNTNTGYGAYLDNTSGTGKVTLNYSTFNGNSENGLRIVSNRAISAKNITADNNGWVGVNLDNSSAASAQPVTISGVNNFNDNLRGGLVVYSRGIITLGYVTAIYNINGDGVYLDNCIYDTGSNSCYNPGSYAVTLKGSNDFSFNGLDGLEVWATGAITANSLTANNNGTAMSSSTNNPLGDKLGMGVYLDNHVSPVPKLITLTGTNSFNWNGATGVWLDSYGLVKVNNLTASYNGNGSSCGLDCDGLDTPINRNHLKGFTLTGYGTFNMNGDSGMHVTTGGTTPITLTNLFADGNVGRGVYLDNSSALGAPNITLTGTNVFMFNGHTGLTVLSFGAITLNNVTASDNSGAGADVDNCLYDSGTGTCTATVPKPVTLNGVNYFNNNTYDGLWVFSLGAITAKQVTANDNTIGRGAYLNNQWGSRNYNITLSGYNMFNGNGSTGLEAYSNGNIVISNLTASENHGGTAGLSTTSYNAGGAYLDNWSTTSAPVNVTLTGFNTFNGNGHDAGGGSYVGSGLIVISKGAITLSNLTANDNYENGAYLDNSSGTLARNITLTGANTFMNNIGTGLNIDSHGKIVLNNVAADFNLGTGVYGGADGTILVTCGSMVANGSYGWWFQSLQTVTLKGVIAYGNSPGETYLTGGTLITTLTCPLP